MPLTARIRTMLLVGMSLLLVGLAGLILSTRESELNEKEDQAIRSRSLSRICTRAGKAYSHGALVRTPEGVVKCEDGAWRRIGD